MTTDDEIFPPSVVRGLSTSEKLGLSGDRRSRSATPNAGQTATGGSPKALSPAEYLRLKGREVTPRGLPDIELQTAQVSDKTRNSDQASSAQGSTVPVSCAVSVSVPVSSVHGPVSVSRAEGVTSEGVTSVHRFA